MNNEQYTDFTVIGEGAFGKVYKALFNNEKYVAIKKIKFRGGRAFYSIAINFPSEESKRPPKYRLVRC
jgi:ATP sulfurylase